MKERWRRFLFHVGVALGPTVIQLLGLTWRVRWIGLEHQESAKAGGRPVMYTLWHGQLLPLTFIHRHRSIQILISRNRDGEILRRVTARLGCGSVEGSTSKGGARAILRMCHLAAKGYDLAITPDGPRGPRCVAQSGVVRIAQRSGCTILPLVAASTRGLRLGSWDRFLIPAPFARLVIGYAPPISVPENLDEIGLEEYRARVENALRDETDRAEEMCGHDREFT